MYDFIKLIQFSIHFLSNPRSIQMNESMTIRALIIRKRKQALSVFNKKNSNKKNKQKKSNWIGELNLFQELDPMILPFLLVNSEFFNRKDRKWKEMEKKSGEETERRGEHKNNEPRQSVRSKPEKRRTHHE